MSRGLSSLGILSSTIDGLVLAGDIHLFPLVFFCGSFNGVIIVPPKREKWLCQTLVRVEKEMNFVCLLVCF